MYNGVVKSAGWHSSYGNVVFVGVNQVKNTNIQSICAHLNSISVNAGQALSGGIKVGTMNSTGNSTAVHLHFETRNCPSSACSTNQSRDANNLRIWYSGVNSFMIDETSQNEFNELHEVDDLSTDSPNYYPLEVLAEMTSEELIEIGYPNPYEDFSK